MDTPLILLICFLIMAGLSWHSFTLHGKLRQLQNQLQTLEAEKAEILAESRAKSIYFSGWSTSLYTPLNSLVSYPKVLLDEPFGKMTEDEIRQDIEHIRGVAEHLLDMIHSLLDWYKLDSGRITFSDLEYSLVKDILLAFEKRYRKEFPNDTLHIEHLNQSLNAKIHDLGLTFRLNEFIRYIKRMVWSSDAWITSFKAIEQAQTISFHVDFSAPYIDKVGQEIQEMFSSTYTFQILVEKWANPSLDLIIPRMQKYMALMNGKVECMTNDHQLVLVLTLPKGGHDELSH